MYDHMREGRNAEEGDGMDCVCYVIEDGSEAGWGIIY